MHEPRTKSRVQNNDKRFHVRCFRVNVHGYFKIIYISHLYDMARTQTAHIQYRRWNTIFRKLI